MSFSLSTTFSLSTMSTDPLTLAARIASDLRTLVDQGYVDEEVLEATLAGLPVQGKAKW